MVTAPPQDGQVPGAQRLSAITWKVDVGRWARLAAATGLRAAILEDVLNGGYTAPCRGESRSGTHQQGWVGPLLWLRFPGARLSFPRALP